MSTEQTQRRVVTIELSEAQANDLSSALADTLCWFAGFQAARPDEALIVERGPLRELNIRIKDQLGTLDVPF
jgi:hypothetical protein